MKSKFPVLPTRENSVHQKRPGETSKFNSLSENYRNMKPFFALLLSFCLQNGFSQYRFDNAAFKTVYWSDLCEALSQHPGHLLLDVRSKGEYADTSSSKTLNLGHVKGAVNIDIREVGNRLNEIEAYRNKPVFVYCSHSQRSRRVSKMLSDSGFTNVFNINGGVSNLHTFGFQQNCDVLVSNLPYEILSPKTLAQAKSDAYFILDVRPDSAFRGIALQERKNAYGKLKKAVNIPLASLPQNLSSLPKGKKILVVDENGNESVAAAETLSQNGFGGVAILFNGLDAYLTEVPEEERAGWSATVPYHTINAVRFDDLMKKYKTTVIDIRTADEFNNVSKESFRNVGNVKEAVNVPFADWDKQQALLPSDKEKPLVVYSFSTAPETFEAAKKLSAQGYKNVNVLLGGLFNIRWRAANIKGFGYLKDRVVNVPSDNL